MTGLELAALLHVGHETTAPAYLSRVFLALGLVGGIGLLVHRLVGAIEAIRS